MENYTFGASINDSDYHIYGAGTVLYIGYLDGYAYYVGTTSDYDTTINHYFGTTIEQSSLSLSTYMIRDAILEVNAGDEIEYVISYENNSLFTESANFNAYIYDIPIFSTGSAMAINNNTNYLYNYYIGSKACGWEYGICTSSYANSSYQFIQYIYENGSVSGDISESTAMVTNYSTCYSDFWKNARDSKNEYLYNNTRFMWTFKTLYAYSTYRQTVIVTVPGNNRISSASKENVPFQDILSAYSYWYCTNNASAVWNTYAYIFKSSTIYVPMFYSFSQEIEHTVAGQLYFNTGTLASMTVDDADNISDKDVYASWNGTLAANNYDASAKYFNADENSIVVNYIYLFNDSPDEMYLDDYAVSIDIPEGFEWAGFTYQTTYDSNRYYAAPSSSVNLNNYYKMNTSLYVDYTRYGDSSGSMLSTSAFSWFSSGSAEGYFAGTEDYVNTASKMSVLGRTAQSYLDDASTALVCSAKNTTGSSIKLNFTMSKTGRPSIAAYSGIVVMYMAKVSDVDKVKELYSGDNNAATFSAHITQTYETVYVNSYNYNHVAISGKNIAQISPVVHACDMCSGSWALQSARQYVCNDGNPNTFLEHQLDKYYTGVKSYSESDVMWSYASLSMVTEKTSVSVEKEVVKNSGSDYAGQYANGASQTQTYWNSLLFSLTETGGFASDYDDYNWHYSLPDGIHRTVDGTVTWKVTLTNTGQDNSGNTGTSVSVGEVSEYDFIDYSTIVETIDSPYHLVEIAVPVNQYLFNYTGSYYTNTVFPYTWSYYELPDADPSDKDAMVAAGWEYDADNDCYYYEIFAKASSNSELATLGTVSVQYPWLAMRVTAKCLEGSSLGYGVDATEGYAYCNENVDAYQYTIEFIENMSGTSSLTMQKTACSMLATADTAASNSAAHVSNTFELYMTFSTDESIETNYNSVGLVLKDVEESDVEVTSGELMTVAEMHGGDAEDDDTTVTTSYNSTTTGTSGSVAADALVVQASDWTDTSYTDGDKTLTVVGDDGNTAAAEDGSDLSVNTKEEGDMVLPDSVEPGTALHNTLKWESVLYESESYSSIDGLVIYDLYGVEADVSTSGEVMYAYDVDFSSISVKLCLTDDIAANTAAGLSLTDTGFSSTELVYGVDYDIYYTTVPLVSTEHHPIPVNTLYYAADYDAMDAADWILYDADNPDADGTGAMAFKIVLKGSTVSSIESGRYTGNADWSQVEIYVDYDATVADSVKDGETYPSVMAWTGQVMYPTEDEDGNEIIVPKSIYEDTTATIFIAQSDYPVLSKSLVDENGENVKDTGSSSLFAFLVLRTDKTSDTGSLAASNITGAALVSARAGSSQLLNDGNMDILYNAYDTDDGSAAAFWDNEGCLYYLVEADAGGYCTSSISVSGADDSGTVASLSVGTGISTIDGYLSAADGCMAVWFTVADAETFADTVITCTNLYVSPDLILTKADTSGETIVNEVSFTLSDKDGNGIVMEGTGGTYSYAGTGTATTMTFSGTAVISGLPEGTYYLTETEAPEGYTANTEPVEITIAADGADPAAVEVTVINVEESSESTGTLAVTKTDSTTGLAITASETAFAVYAADGSGEALWFIKTQEGHYWNCEEGTSGAVQSLVTYYGELVVEGLPYGPYALKETDAPDGYLLSTDPVEFTVSRSDSHAGLEFEDEPVSGSLSVSKVDGDGNAITGNPAQFVLYDGSGNAVAFSGKDGVYAYSEYGKVTELITSGSGGTLSLTGLPEGTYYLEETQAPAGYEKAGTQWEISVTDNSTIGITAENEKLELSIKLTKLWRSESGTKTYAFEGITFILYEADGDFAAEAMRGTTRTDGSLDFDGLDWEKTYYLYEEVPEGYSSDYDVTVYRNDSTGEIDLSLTAETAGEGYTAITCLVLDFASLVKDGSTLITEGQNGLVYSQEIINVKLNKNGGLYASTSYKTISNTATAAEYDQLTAETGYSYYYTEDDYAAGNYNYVHAANEGDTVTYTLNVTNVSNYGFYGMSLIDRMPETGDTGIVNSSASRGSEFTVKNPADIHVYVDGKELDSDEWGVSYSTKVTFTSGDFNGTTTWDADAGSAKSFRILMAEDFVLEPGQTLTVSYDGTIGDDSEIGEIAWNNFAYRYTAGEGSSALTLTPEPPKVGVKILGQDFTVTKEWDDAGDELGIRPDSISVSLCKTDGTDSEAVSAAAKITEKDGVWNHTWTGLRLLKTGYWYTVLEDAVDGYVASLELSNGTSAVLTNSVRKGSIKVIKEDANGNVLEGAGFTLYDSDGEITDTGTTGKDGILVFEGLKPGTYRLTETQSPDGYELLADAVEITIPYSMTDAEVKSGDVDTANAVYSAEKDTWYFYDLTYIVSDAANLDLPVTGSADNRFLFVSLLAAFMLLAIGMERLSARRRRNVCQDTSRNR